MARSTCWRLRVASFVLASVGRVAHAQNFAPIAVVAADPLEAQLGQTVSFSSDGSRDPDSGPEPLSFHWDFGDGASADTARPTHVYSASGYWTVTLTVSDGDRQGFASLEVAVLAPARAERARSARPLALSPDGSALWVVNTDSNSISVVILGDRSVTEVSVGRSPRTLTFGADGAEVFVACQDGDLWVLESTRGTVSRQRAVAPGLFGVVSRPSGEILVSSEATGEVVVLDSAAGDVVSRIDVGGTPRALAVTGDGSRAFVSHFLTRGDAGRITEIALEDGSTRHIQLVENPGPDTASSGAGFPNLLGALAIEPSGRRLWTGGLKANTGRGAYVSGVPLVPRNRVRGLLAPIDIELGEEILERRIDTNDADSVSDVDFSPSGRYAYLTHPGAGTLSVYDLVRATRHDSTDGDTVPFESRTDVGDAPRGVLASLDGTHAYVLSYLSRQVLVLDVSDPSSPSIEARIDVTSEPLAARMLNGKRLFFRSTEPVHSEQNYIACASCHPDGGHDGRTWDFTQFGEGLRNTIDLRGHAGLGHGPVHWSANFDEIQDFENDIVHGFGGTGLAADGAEPNPPLGEPNAGRSKDLDDLALYVSSLASFPRSPHRAANGALTPAALRGRTLFFDEARRCTVCHVPPRFTNSSLSGGAFTLYDVGTLGPASGQRLGEPLTGIDTPTLLGIWASPPYLHDGSAQTLRHVLRDRNAQDEHGVTSDLGDAELADLVAYLQSLDGSQDEIPPGWKPTEQKVADAGIPDGGLVITGDAARDAGAFVSDSGVRETGGREAGVREAGVQDAPDSRSDARDWKDAGSPGRGAAAGDSGCSCRVGAEGRGPARSVLGVALLLLGWAVRCRSADLTRGSGAGGVPTRSRRRMHVAAPGVRQGA